MQVAWPGAREGTARSERTGNSLGECVSRVDQRSPASPCWGTNQVPGHQRQVRFSSPAPGEGWVGDPVSRRSGLSAVGSVHQSCYTSCLLFFLATLQLLRVQLTLMLSAPTSGQEEQCRCSEHPAPAVPFLR